MNTMRNCYRDHHSGGLVFYGESTTPETKIKLLEEENEAIKKENKELKNTVDSILKRLENLEGGRER